MHDWGNASHYQLRWEGSFNGFLTWIILRSPDKDYFGIVGPTLFIRRPRKASDGWFYVG